MKKSTKISNSVKIGENSTKKKKTIRSKPLLSINPLWGILTIADYTFSLLFVLYVIYVTIKAVVIILCCLLCARDDLSYMVLYFYINAVCCWLIYFIDIHSRALTAKSFSNIINIKIYDTVCCFFNNYSKLLPDKHIVMRKHHGSAIITD